MAVLALFVFLVKNKQKSAKNVQKKYLTFEKNLFSQIFFRRECCQKVIFSRKNGFDKFQEDLKKGSRKIFKGPIFLKKNPKGIS